MGAAEEGEGEEDAPGCELFGGPIVTQPARLPVIAERARRGGGVGAEAKQGSWLSSGGRLRRQKLAARSQSSSSSLERRGAQSTCKANPTRAHGQREGAESGRRSA